MSIYREWGLEPIINVSGAVTRLGGAPMPMAPAEFSRFIADETEKWAKVIRRGNLKPV